MTTFKQIEANRRKALKSTSPTSAEGKQRSRKNAVRHGLTAETVIGALEDAADYRAFEAAVIADYDAPSCVERELVLRLASLLWRLRRATIMETGLFEIQAEHRRGFKLAQQVSSDNRQTIYSLFPLPKGTDDAEDGSSEPPKSARKFISPDRSDDAALAHCFLRLANLPSCPLDRLS